MDRAIKQMVWIFNLTCMAMPAASSSIRTPFLEQLLLAELVVTGTVHEKKYGLRDSKGLIVEGNPVNNKMVEKTSQDYLRPYTEYKVHVDEVIKGKFLADVVNLEAIGGCDEISFCMSVSTGYEYEIGDAVFILLKKSKNDEFYRSTHRGSSAYLINDEGIIYKNAYDLAYIKRSELENAIKSEPRFLYQIKAIVAEQLKHLK